MTNSRLEELMAIDPTLMSEEIQKELFDELGNTRFLLPVVFNSNPIDMDGVEEGQIMEIREPLSFTPITVRREDSIILPLFTNEEALKIMGKVNVISYHSEDIAKLLIEGEGIDEIVINPNTESSIGMPVESFIYHCMEEEFDTIFDIEEDIKKYGVPLEENTRFYLRSETPFMAENADEGVFVANIPFNASSADVCNTDFRYLNVLLVPKGTVFLYLGNIIDDVTKNNDVLLAPTLKFKLTDEFEDTFTWECVSQDLE